MRKFKNLGNSLIATVTVASLLFSSPVFAEEVLSADAAPAEVVEAVSEEAVPVTEEPVTEVPVNEAPAEEAAPAPVAEEPVVEQPVAEESANATPAPVEAATVSEEAISEDTAAAVVTTDNATAKVATATVVTSDTADWDGIVVDGQPGQERLMRSGTIKGEAQLNSVNSDGSGVNTANFSYDTSYIWVVEKKGYTFKARIPYWFMNAYPKAAFYIGKGKTKVSIPIYTPEGKKIGTKSATLNTDSQLWLGNYESDDNIVCPPWLKKVFSNKVQEGISSADSACWITCLPVYKNAKALKNGKWTLYRKVEYYHSGKYRITTVMYNPENPGGDFQIGF